MKTKKLFSLLLVVVLFSISYYLFFNGYLSVTKLEHLLIAGGWLAPMFYIVLHLIRPFSFLPSSLLVLAAGLVFDFWWGLFLCIFGFMLASTIIYILGIRWGDFGAFKNYMEKIKEITKVLQGKSKYFLASICLMPILPADLVSYASGVAGMKFIDFIGGKLLGSFPGLFLVFLSGNQIKAGEWISMAIALTGLVTLTLIVWIKKKELIEALEYDRTIQPSANTKIES